MSSELELEADKTLKSDTYKDHSDQLLNIYCKTCSSVGCQDRMQIDQGHDYDTDPANKDSKATKEHSSLKQMFKKLKVSKNKKHKANGTCEASSAEQSRDTAVEVPRPTYPLYVAKYDYQPRTKSDLGFEKKELLYIVNTDDEDWWWARAKDTGQEGYIPSSYVVDIEASIEAEVWFHKAMSRTDAERHLAFSPVGSFLVRDRVGHPGTFTLSVKHEEERVRHYTIRVMDSGRYCISCRISFATIPELINYYSEQADGLCITLKEPFIITDPPQTAGLSKETNEAWDIEWSSIHLLNMLGADHGSTLWEGKWNDTVPISVRVFNSDILVASEFRKALTVMRNLRHPNLVQVLAACTQEDPDYPIFMVTELMRNGSLLHYLRSDGHSLKLPHLIQMAVQVTHGMAYLEARMYTHGNLAAKNVLLTDNLICRLADYGIVQEHLYVKEEDYNIPRYSSKWAAPEVLKSNQFSVKSDVWSFGILLYELITYGHSPYPDISDNVVQRVMDGYRMSCPKDCPQQLYEIMMECWRDDPASRPTFESLQWRMEDFFIESEPTHLHPDQIK